MSFSDYPQNPTIGVEYTVGNMIVVWDGTKFVSVPPILNGNIRSVNSIEDLRNTPALLNGQQVFLSGYYAGSTKGAGPLTATITGSPVDDGGVNIAGPNCQWTRQLDGYVTPEMFGLIAGDSDSTSAIRATHEYANSTNTKVSYSGISAFSIDADSQIPVNTNVDFCNAEIRILNGMVASPTGEATVLITYVISDPDCPLVTVTGVVTDTDLQQGSFTPTKGLFDGHGFARLECGYQVPNREKTGTQNYVQVFKVNRQGVSSQPLSAGLQGFASDVTVSYRKTSNKRLLIENISLRDSGFNSLNLIRIERCNVEINGFSCVFDTESGTYPNADRLINLRDVSDVTIKNLITTGRQVSSSIGSYALSVNGAADIIVDNMNAITGWGATGTNNISGVKFINSTLNRIDAHSSGHNIFAENCELYSDGVAYGWGGGVIHVNNCRIYRTAAITTRSDYGGSFFGDLVVSDCEFVNANSATIYAINLLSNPMGASTPVFAPNSVTVSNAKRTARAGGNNAEFITVGMAIRSATDIVHAPSSVNAENIKSHASWRVGMVIDYLNMESNASGVVTRISLSSARATSAATSTTGVRELDQIRSQTSAPRVSIRVSEVENLHVRCRADNGPDITINNCVLNGVTVNTAASIQPRVVIDGCDFANQILAKVGGNRSGNSNFTIIRNSEFTGIAWDLSGASALIGNTFRSSATPPTLPAGVTIADAFTGWKDPAHFQ